MIRGQVASGEVALRLHNAYFEQDVCQPAFREHLICRNGYDLTWLSHWKYRRILLTGYFTNQAKEAGLARAILLADNKYKSPFPKCWSQPWLPQPYHFISHISALKGSDMIHVT